MLPLVPKFNQRTSVKKVTDISFEIIDYKTGEKNDDPDNTASTHFIYTVYTVTVDEYIKGEGDSTVKICKMGGIAGYLEEEQYALLKSSGILNDETLTIVLCNDDCTLKIGSDYLFCTIRWANGYDHIMNPIQFAHHTDSENAKMIKSGVKQ